MEYCLVALTIPRGIAMANWNTRATREIAKDTHIPISVREYEPHLALFGGVDGLDFYRAIAKNYAAALKPGGYLAFEFGDDQGDDVCRILEDNGYTIIERAKDFNDRERAVLAQYGGKDD